MQRRTKPGGDVIRRISLILVAIAMSSVPCVASAQLKGDPRAVSLADGLVEAIGGRNLWQRAQYLYIEEQVYSGRYPKGVRTRLYRDLVRPRLKYQQLNVKCPSFYVVGEERGWTSTDSGQTQAVTDEALRRYRDRWPQNIYVLYRRLAVADPELTLELVAEQVFAVHEGGREIGRFQLDGTHHLLRWTAPTDPGERAEDWIYGPSRKLGKVHFPDWGTRADGSYRFYYKVVRLLSQLRSDEFSEPIGNEDCPSVQSVAGSAIEAEPNSQSLHARRHNLARCLHKTG